LRGLTTGFYGHNFIPVRIQRPYVTNHYFSKKATPPWSPFSPAQRDDR